MWIDQEDFNGTVGLVTFHPGSIDCVSHPIIISNDDINEATEQVFIIRLTLARSQNPDMVNLSQSISLGIIIDDDRK